MTATTEIKTAELVKKGNIVDILNLKMYFPVRRGLLKRKVADVKALDDVSFSIKPGETVGLVGESGCGKTTVGRCIMRLYKPTNGVILFEGTDISSVPDATLRQFRRRMALVFQDPYSSLDPRMSSGEIVGEPLKIHRLVKSKNEFKERVAELFVMTGLSPDMMDRYPHEYSGGQRQRLSIARALAGDPSMIGTASSRKEVMLRIKRVLACPRWPSSKKLC
jgi:ABC-type oligopeptide transport system ATPase subunit